MIFVDFVVLERKVLLSAKYAAHFRDGTGWFLIDGSGWILSVAKHLVNLLTSLMIEGSFDTESGSGSFRLVSYCTPRTFRSCARRQADQVTMISLPSSGTDR